MIWWAILFIASCVVAMHSALWTTRSATNLAQHFRIAPYIVGFVVVAIVSILPELFITIHSAILDEQQFALGVLLGSNVADLTLIFGLTILFAGRDMHVGKGLVRQTRIYPLFLLLPVLLGFDGVYTRSEGVLLFLAGILCYGIAFKEGHREEKEIPSIEIRPSLFKEQSRSFGLLLCGVLVLLGGSFGVVESATHLAEYIGISSFLIGIFIVGLGTTMPELLFALRSLKERKDDMALGDILGTVIADATIVLGVLIMINPFTFPPRIIYISGVAMVICGLVLFSCIRSGKGLSRKEAFLLIALWVCFISAEIGAEHYML